MKKAKTSYTVYFGSELFTVKHLIGNSYLAEAIYEKSHGKFHCVLPQDFELRDRPARVIRDQDIRAVLDCDLALFSFDGTELDSGTVVEFMLAKFADIPTVIVRSDIRNSGDQSRGDPWNLMVSHWPRTVVVRMDSLPGYRALLARRRTRLDSVLRLAGQHSSATAQLMCEQIAGAVVRALNRVLTVGPAMPRHVREEVYQWLTLLPGLRGKAKDLRKLSETLLKQKVERDLL